MPPPWLKTVKTRILSHWRIFADRANAGNSGGFTLIELLIVVAIITILALIAVPNFLEAQVRSKVSRVRADLRTVATAIEAYRVDHNHYPPNDGIFNVLPIELTTPVAFISTGKIVDPFTDKELHPFHGQLVRFYTYHLIVPINELQQHVQNGNLPAVEAIDGLGFNRGAMDLYGPWKLVSFGPDKVYSQPGIPVGPWNRNNAVLFGSDVPYDPTNGTVSFGNIHRTQKHPTTLPPS